MPTCASPQDSLLLHLSKMLWSFKTELDRLLHTEQISPASRTESTLSLLSIFDWHTPTLLPSPTSPHHHALRTQTLSLKKRPLSMHFRCRLNKWTWRENTALCRLKNFWPGTKVPKIPQPKPESHIHCSRYCVFNLWNNCYSKHYKKMILHAYF